MGGDGRQKKTNRAKRIGNVGRLAADKFYKGERTTHRPLLY